MSLVQNTIRSRILGYDILIEKPSECGCCKKKTEPDILDRVLDNEDGVLKYALVLKCRSCHEISLVTYLIGREKQLSIIEEESSKKPIKPNKSKS